MAWFDKAPMPQLTDEQVAALPPDQRARHERREVVNAHPLGTRKVRRQLKADAARDMKKATRNYRRSQR